MSLIEAFAHGVPVLTSDVGAQAELVTDGVTGLHFTAGDDAGLSAQAERLWRDGRLRAEMGARALEEYRRSYTPAVNLGLLLSVYEAALAAA